MSSFLTNRFFLHLLLALVFIDFFYPVLPELHEVNTGRYLFVWYVSILAICDAIDNVAEKLSEKK